MEVHRLHPIDLTVDVCRSCQAKLPMEPRRIQATLYPLGFSKTPTMFPLPPSLLHKIILGGINLHHFGIPHSFLEGELLMP
jgi:hypothetical protein